MKIVYSDKKSGKTAQLEVAKDGEAMLIGKKIGEVIEGNVIGLEGFKLQITGLSRQDRIALKERSGGQQEGIHFA